MGALSALGLDVTASDDEKASQVDVIEHAAADEHASMMEAVEEADAMLEAASEPAASVTAASVAAPAAESAKPAEPEQAAAAAKTPAASAASAASVAPAAAPAPAKSNKLGKRTIFSIFITCIGVPVVVAAGLLLGDVNFYLTSVVIIFLVMLPFFVRFEGRSPQARELVVIAVMTAIAAASRAAFVWLPMFSPLIGIAIITAIALGPEQGFITGALSAFVSNFLFGQGPWTPWQMFAYGIGAFVAGLLVRKGILKVDRWPLTIFGFFIVAIFVGPILDTCTVFVITPGTVESMLAVYLAGVPVNIVHGLATALTIALVSKPLCEKIERIRVKYGMAEA